MKVLSQATSVVLYSMVVIMYGQVSDDCRYMEFKYDDFDDQIVGIGIDYCTTIIQFWM